MLEFWVIFFFFLCMGWVFWLTIWLLGSCFRWWAPSKFDPVKSPMLFFEKGLPVIPPVPPAVGLDMVLKHMVWHCFSKFYIRTNVPCQLITLGMPSCAVNRLYTTNSLTLADMLQNGLVFKFIIVHYWSIPSKFWITKKCYYWCDFWFKWNGGILLYLLRLFPLAWGLWSCLKATRAYILL